jgi:oxygen-dependent protoporphyrinogen oxidase
MRSLSDDNRHSAATAMNGDASASGRRVAVVGAGITGLVTAWHLAQQGVDVTLFEASGQAGGAIRTTHADQFLAEHGPNSFVTSPAVEQLLADLDLLDDVVEASRTANRRYVVRRGSLLPFPLSPLAMLSTSLFSLRAKLRVLLEPLVARGTASRDESIASFVRRRLGSEVLDFAVDPFISGIFAGDPEQLSLQHAFPRIHELEQTHGSLSQGLMAQRRAARAVLKRTTGRSAPTEPLADETPERAAPQGTRLISFLDGMQSLTDALVAGLAGRVQLGCPVRLLHRDASHWLLEAGADGAVRTHTFDAVVMATPAHVLAAMELPGAMRTLTAAIDGVQYPPVSTLTLGFAREDVTHPLDGFGMLIPARERRHILGALFNSTLFPNRAPDGYVTITCFVGGARAPDVARDGTDVVVERVLGDLRDLLGVRGEPVFAQHVFWPRAIPQYNVGYASVKRAAEATEAANPGLYLVGNYRYGVSVGSCVASGQQVAARVQEFLAHAP